MASSGENGILEQAGAGSAAFPYVILAAVENFPR
jgi:hypothetical protein